MKIPYYLFASGLCLAIAISACSDGPTDVSDEAALSSEVSAVDQANAKRDGSKQDKYDICHYDGDANGGVGALIHLNVNGNSWNNPAGDGCGGKNNGKKLTGHNGHEMDVNWQDSTIANVIECSQFCFEDRDGDGWTDDEDNCIDDYNPDQTNTDGLEDGGDACDPDDDEDGVLDDDDNCRVVPNPGQEDNWGGDPYGAEPDGEGDACDDTDGDGTNDDTDTCQLDDTSADGDNQDFDGWCDSNDNCVDISNPDQTDSDSDGAGDSCDTCEFDDTSSDGVNTDGDGWCDSNDNCVDTVNDDQANADGDINGDACELCTGDDATGDSDGDGDCDDVDICPLDANNDIDGDGVCGDLDACPNEGELDCGGAQFFDGQCCQLGCDTNADGTSACVSGG